MATHDSIGDFLTIIRNASTAGKEVCVADWSKIREGIAGILKDEGYIFVRSIGRKGTESYHN